jgi:hypothetical protein
MLNASLPKMVRLLSTRATKVFLAVRASHSVLAHMFCSRLINDFSIVILDVIIYLALNELDQITAFAFEHIFVTFEEFVCKLGCDFIILFVSEAVADFGIQQLLITVVKRTLGIRICKLHCFLHTRSAYLVTTKFNEH